MSMAGARRGWIAPMVVLAVIVVVVAGGFVVASALSKPAGPPIVVGGAVQVFPLSGWQAGTERTAAGLATVRLTRGNADLEVWTTQVNAGPEVLLVRYVDQILRPQAGRLSVSKTVEPVALSSGETGLRVSYVGSFGDRTAQVDGEVTAVVSSDGTGAIFDAWGPVGLFGYARGDTRTMVDTAVIG